MPVWRMLEARLKYRIVVAWRHLELPAVCVGDSCYVTNLKVEIGMETGSHAPAARQIDPILPHLRAYKNKGVLDIPLKESIFSLFYSPFPSPLPSLSLDQPKEDGQDGTSVVDSGIACSRYDLGPCHSHED